MIPTYYNLAIWALTVWREARGLDYKGKLAVAFVIRNRMVDPRKRWPHTPSGVCLQPRQFSCFNADDPNAVKLPKDTDAAFLECCRAVEEAETPGSFDPTRGANHYHHLPLAKAPAWADPNRLTAVIGKGRFYRL